MKFILKLHVSKVKKPQCPKAATGVKNAMEEEKIDVIADAEADKVHRNMAVMSITEKEAIIVEVIAIVFVPQIQNPQSISYHDNYLSTH